MLDNLTRLVLSCDSLAKTDSRKDTGMIQQVPDRIKRYCAWCKNPYMAKRSDSRFCSDRCRQLSARWRKRLTTLEQQCDMAIDAIAVYMQYDDTRDAARRTLYRINARAVKSSRREKAGPS